MTPQIQKILKTLAKELTIEVTKMVTERLRESYVDDITGIVKDCLKNDELFQGSEVGFLTIEAICEKYKVSRKTVNNKCTLFGVERRRVGKHNLVNELQFFKAHDNPAEKPQFLKNRDAAY